MTEGLSWQELLAQATTETDTQKLRDTVVALESAIFFRCQELTQSAPDIAERTAIEEASLVLFKIKVEKLGFPASGISTGPSAGT